MQAARLRNAGLLKALSLTAAAVVREVAAYSLKREEANEIWAAALGQTYKGVAEHRPSQVIN